MKRKNIKRASIPVVLIALISTLTYYKNDIEKMINPPKEIVVETFNVNDIPEYSGSNYVILNGNIPEFSEYDYKLSENEIYSPLDKLGRAGVAFAKVGLDTMPKEKRGSIGMIKPTGWHTVKYAVVEGKYLYNRCHLIGYQLTGENANEKNLITCTRQMNSVGMLEWENKVAEYVKKTKNHVLYRVRPIYIGDNLLASGVVMEAKSIEDEGKGITFNVYVYNVQDKIEIDYSSGNSKLIKNINN